MTSLIRIAFRNVLRNRRRSLITFSAVFIALGAMTSVRGFLNGLQSTIREAVVFGQAGALQIHRKGFLKSMNGASLDLDVPTDAAFMAKVTSSPGVRAVAPRIAFGGMVNVGDTTTPALFTAIDPLLEAQVCPRRAEMVTAGRTLLGTPPESAVFTPELSGKLGITLEQNATLLANDKDGVLNAQDLKLVGSYGQAGVPLPEKKFGFVSLAFAQGLLGMDDRATELAVAVDAIDTIDAIKPLLEAAVGDAYEVSTWREVAPWVDDAIKAQDFMLNLLAGTFLFVALLGIINTMLMSVYERTREIGTMMSVGVRRSQILGLFLLEAGLLGLSGGILGATAGGAFVLYLARKGIALRLAGMSAPMHVVPTVDAAYILTVLVLATGGAVIAALWPSLRASRLRPVEALAAV